MHTRMTRRMLSAHRTVFLIGVLLVGPCWQCLGQTGRVLDLCDALHDFESYSAKVIEVEGDYVAAREIVGLYGHECKTPIVLDGVVRPAAAAIREPRSATVGGQVVDSTAIEKLHEAVNQHRRIASHRGLRVILKGKLNGPAELPSYVDKNGKQRRMGFGHLGVFPFQIELITVRVIDNFEEAK